MKKIAFITLLTLITFISKAQAKPSLTDVNGIVWQNAILRADGVTEIEGVEAYYLKTKCANQEFVLIKFINNNNFRVGVQWLDAVWVNGVWFYSKNNNSKKVYIEANETITGSCESENKLKVNVSTIIDKKTEFQHFTVSGLQLIK